MGNNKYAKNEIKGVGIGLRHRHFQEFIEDKPDVSWLEVHSENFLYLGSAAAQCLEDIRQNYPLSAHCVGLSLGSYDNVDKKHLESIKIFIDHFEPALVSDHLSWSAGKGRHLPDLLPMPYTEEALKSVCRNIAVVQDFLNRTILIENPSSYLTFASSQIPEWEFYVEVARRTGCGLLLDVNNIQVSAHNHSFSAENYIEYIPEEVVREIHLAGYSSREVEGKLVYIDDHSTKVYDEVWELYKKAITKFRRVPTLIEWDTDIPELAVLLEEKSKAGKILTLVEQNQAVFIPERND